MDRKAMVTAMEVKVMAVKVRTKRKKLKTYKQFTFTTT